MTIVGASILAVTLGAPFGDHMVLQRDRQVPVWGTARSGERVTVSFADSTQSAVADGSGRWRVELGPFAASSSPRRLVVKGAQDEKTVEDVLVGEVWLAGGQSNMDCPTWGKYPRFCDEQGMFVSQLTKLPQVRYVTAPGEPYLSPTNGYRRPFTWRAAVPENLTRVPLSAVAFYFARELQPAIGIPVGVICAACGGTNIDAWIPQSGLAQVPELADLAGWKFIDREGWNDPKVKKYPIDGFQQQPTVLWNGYLAPLGPLAVRGMLWYQGERNCVAGEAGPRYLAKLKALHAGWSHELQNPDLKLYVVQLCSWGYDIVAFQETQRQFCAAETNAHLAVINDLGDLKDIHPPRKEQVGRRLAALALKYEYGFHELTVDSPVLMSATAEGPRVRLRFSSTGRLTLRTAARDDLSGIELAGPDGKFHRAAIQNLRKVPVGDISYGAIDGSELIVAADGVDSPKRVRYLSASPQIGCLFNEYNLPVAAFDAEVAGGAGPKTVDSTGRPVYGKEPLPTYDESALSAPRRERLERETPERLRQARKALDSLSGRIRAEFAGAADSVQAERIRLRMGMARRLCDVIEFEHAKGTVSGLCQAESGIEAMKAFLAYFEQELEAWKVFPLAPGVKPETFDIRDFGAKGDGVTDDEPALRAAVVRIAALQGRPSVLRLPGGEYLLQAKSPGGKSQPVLNLPAVTNCVIEGDSPETTKIVYGEYDGNGLGFDDWKNSALRNVQVYMRENPFVEGEVESVDRTGGSLVLRHHEGTLKPDDPRFKRIGYPNSCMQFDRNGLPIKTPVLWYDYRCEDLGGDRYRMFFDPEQGSTRSMPVEPGAIFVFPDRSNRISALSCPRSEFFIFENVWIRNSRAGAFTTAHCHMPTLVRCRVFPKDPRFCLSTNADGNFTAVGTAILHCDFTNMNDDGSNSHNKGRVFIGHDESTGRWAHETNWIWERPGDFVQVISSLDGRFLMNTRVRSVENQPGDRTRQFTVFEDPLPQTVRSYTSLGIEPHDPLSVRKIRLGTMKTDKFPDQFYVTYSQGIGYLCCFNRFSNIRGVAVQIQSSNALVLSNRIENVYRGIELSGLLHYQEGPPPYNVIISGNRIRNVNLGIKSTFMTLNHPPALTTPMARLLIADNTVEGAAEKALILANAEDCVVGNNVLEKDARVEVRVCRDIRFTGNRLGDGPLDGSTNIVEFCSKGVEWK